MTRDPHAPDVIQVRLPSRLELLGVLDHVSQAVCQHIGLGEELCSRITMSVIEAGTNAIQHGHRRDPSKMVEVKFMVNQARLEVEVRDQGTGFDLTTLEPNVTGPEHLLDLRGRGIFIMRSCMDEVEFDFTEHGTVCHMVKRLTPVPEEA